MSQYIIGNKEGSEVSKEDDATQSDSGLMSTTDKAKLDNLETFAVLVIHNADIVFNEQELIVKL